MSHSNREKLVALVEHHFAHDHPQSAVPFINLLIDNETGIQFMNTSPAGNGEFTVSSWAAESPEFDDLRAFAEQSERFEPSELSQVGLDLTEKPDAETVIEIFEDLLQRSGRTAADLTFAVEEDCPDGGRTTWNDVVGETVSKPTEVVEDAEELLEAVYAHLHELDQAAEGDIPDPFPVATLYADGEELPYQLCPGVQSLQTEDEALRERFKQVVQEYSVCEVAAEDQGGVSISQYDWAPDTGMEVTQAVFEEVLNVGLSDLSHIDVVRGENERRWTVTDIE